jgi:hypothetical protein
MKSKNITFEDKLKCKICGKQFQHLGSHIWHKHKITARQYKEKFGLPYNMALISEKIYEKKVKAFDEHREKYLSNINKDNGYRFKKGKTGTRRISELERKRIIERIEKVNKRKPEKCPVCNMVFDHLDSHLYNKHKLLRIK